MSVTKNRKELIVYGSKRTKDVTVTSNNVLVSFRSLLTAPWC